MERLALHGRDVGFTLGGDTVAEEIALTHDEHQRLRALHDEIAPTRQAIEKLKRIGTIDVTDLEQRFNDLIQTREGLMREFPPRRLPT